MTMNETEKPMPPDLNPLTADDESHLNLLGVFYYVWAGLSVFGGIMSLVIFVGMLGLMSQVSPQAGPNQEIPTQFFALMVGIGLISVVVSIGFGALYYYCGRFLRERRYRVFCMVIAVIACLNVPLGTILGIFTIIVINRPGVQRAFDANG